MWGSFAVSCSESGEGKKGGNGDCGAMEVGGTWRIGMWGMGRWRNGMSGWEGEEGGGRRFVGGVD